MSSAETSKKERAEEKAPLPLKVTVEDPNTGDTVTFKPNFFVGLYTRRDGVPEEAVGVGQIVKGAANTLEQIAVVKAMQEKVTPMLLSQIDEKTKKLIEEFGEPPAKRDIILATLLMGALFPDD